MVNLVLDLVLIANGDQHYSLARIARYVLDCDSVAVGDEQPPSVVRRLQRRIEYASTTYGFGETPSP